MLKNILKSFFTYSSDSIDLKDFTLFFQNVKNPHVLQHPLWNNITQKHKKVCFFYSKHENKITAFACIIEHYRTATIQFGPLALTETDTINAITEIYQYYKAHNFGKLTITLPNEVSNLSEYIEYTVNKSIPFTQTINEQNWTSTIFRIDNNLDEIFKTFSENHKRSIKKAQKENYVFSEMKESDLAEFAELYNQLYKSRNIIKPFQNTYTVFRDLYSFLKNAELGSFLILKDREMNIKAGILLLFNGSTAFYQYGASDPNTHTPLMHLLFYESIPFLQKRGIKNIDLGGYNHMVSETNQIFNINKFKKGFNGRMIFHGKSMIFKPNRLVYLCLSILIKVKKLLGK